MIRLYDWQLRFAQFTKERTTMAFAWGSNDCALFAVDAVLAITGKDFGGGWRATYDSAGAAMRRVAEHGGLRAIASEALGAQIPPLAATVGDVVLVQNDGRELLGVCNGLTVLAPGSDGLVVLTMDAALAAWSV